jgi:branched-chain amino acid transport system ATP-binding protein
VVFGLADRIMVMNYGEVVSTGSIEAVRADPRVREVYLGKEMVHA